MKQVNKDRLSRLAQAKQARKNLNRRIARKNAAFEGLKPAEKRVAIARDVLAQLASGRLVADTGFWLGNSESTSDDNHLIDADDLASVKNTELQSILGEMDTCTGCALGGLFMCAVEKYDKLKVKDLKEYEYCSDRGDNYDAEDLVLQTVDTVNYLRKFFSNDQLQLIECAFEMGQGAWSEEDYCDDHCDEARLQTWKEACKFATDEMYPEADCDLDENPGLRMKLIMENIVANNGMFMPNKRPQVQLVWTTPGFKG